MLPRQSRLTRPADYRAVLRGGDGRRRQRSGTDLLVVHVARPAVRAGADSAPQDHPPTRPPRVGFVVSGAVGGSVVRHRVVRRLRHLLADRLAGLPAGCDVVVRAQPPAAAASSTELAAALDRALGRALAGAGR